MDSKTVVVDKPHAVCIPSPFQSHIKAMLKFAKLLHRKGFHITFVNTEFNHQRFLKSGGPNSLDGLPDFRFETIPDSLPPSDINASQDLASVCESIMKNFLAPFSNLLVKLNTATSDNSSPPVTSIISDGFMAFTITAARELGIPIVMLFTIAACSLMAFKQFPSLMDNGLTPLKDESYLTNGYLDTVIDWIPGVPMLCWPFGGDQQTNCKYACNDWGIGMEIDNDVKREEVEKLVGELMEGEKGRRMKKKVMEWKNLAQEATGAHGSSSINLNNLVNEVLLSRG
ncbi:UDP-glycosyltransferase 85A2 [Morella rubra]|uniref:UDP-glycosyltransferase 85A2 n=1 Tax=Morella rubra TaxID=262757 RepID=A0A6A1VKV4_9ROSI|nr:UDP-glycosyltransferase 85A2 [Morella rubra]KAB1213205.1 UDP-glycosyltransferase 85A2 [Morella rubra]